MGLGTNILPASLGTARGGGLLHSLRALRVPPTSVDTVAFTHLHTDHTRLAFVRDSDQVLCKALPHADYLVAGAEWAPFRRGDVHVGAPSWDEFMVPMSHQAARGAEGEPGNQLEDSS